MTRALAIAMLLAVALRAEDAPTVTVVHTWKELAATPEIVLKDGSRVRLGIEARRAPADSHVLLYLLNDKEDLEIHQRSECIGPLKLQFKPPHRALNSMLQEKSLGTGANLSYLWCASLRISANETLCLMDADRVVASVDLKLGAKTFHPWLSLAQGSDQQDELQDAGTERVLPLSNQGEYEATPAIQSCVPFVAVHAERLESTQLLPHLLTEGDEEAKPAVEVASVPAALIRDLSSDDFDTREAASRKLSELGKAALPALATSYADATDAEVKSRLKALIDASEGDFHAEWINSGLHLTFRQPIDCYRPQRRFLARWWVNGKPHSAADSEVREIREGGGMVDVNLVNKVTLRLAVDYNQLAAKTGDTITLQIMYAPTDYVSTDSEYAMAMEYSDDIDLRPLVSNKVEFTAP